MSFNDPLIRSIIKKHVPRALLEKSDELLDGYLSLIVKALPKEDTLDGTDLQLFCDLIGYLQPHKAANNRVKLFFRDSKVKDNMMSAIPYQTLQLQLKSKSKSKSANQEDAQATAQVPTYEFTPAQIRYYADV